MATPAAAPKRNRGNKLGERRGKGDAGSSRDASEEDNDNASDVGSLLGVQTTTPHPTTSTGSGGGDGSSGLSPTMRPPSSSTLFQSALAGTKPKALHKSRVEELGGEGSQSEGLDSPTYDGDIESSSTIGGTPIHNKHAEAHQHPHPHHTRRPSSPTPDHHSSHPHHHHQHPLSSSPKAVNRLPTPKASRANLASGDIDEDANDAPSSPEPIASLSLKQEAPAPAPGRTYYKPTDVYVHKSISLPEATRKQTLPLSAKPSATNLNLLGASGVPSSPGPPKMFTRPVELPEVDIKGFVERAIHGRGEEDGVMRWWKTNPPPEGKVVRVYADGVYDLFHFGHALQLRQAKLSFPQVQLLVGVCSDALCAAHKSAPAMTHAERCEAVRHCRWVDEVLPDAPWVVDQEWLDKYDIDYIAHDEEVYPSKDHDDVYGFAKEQGRFVPTRRTPSISTSDLLERIVRGYRDGFFDSKLEKNGHPELLAADVDWDSSASVEKRERRAARIKRAPLPKAVE